MSEPPTPTPDRGAPGGSGPPEPLRVGREPAFNLPGVVTAVIAAILAVFAAQWLLGLERELELMSEAAVVPARFGLAFGLETPQGLVAAARSLETAAEQRQAGALLAYFVDGDGPRWWSLVTYALLHAGVAHVLMNTLWLAVFGAPVARRLGTAPFLALFALGAMAGALLHVWLFPASATPLVGASASVSALTGAAVRFVFSVPFNPAAMGRDEIVRLLPALSLPEVARNRMALAFTGFWFLTNWLFGAGVVPLAGADQSVAWQAHVGGFLAGLLLFPLLDRRTRARA